MSLPSVASADNGSKATPGNDSQVDSCELGDELTKVGEYEAAKKAFLKGLESTADLDCAAEGLEGLRTTSMTGVAEEECAVGDAFHDADRDDDATSAYKKALEADPTSGCATEGLEKAGHGGPDRLTDVADDVAGSIPTILVYAALVLLAGYAVLLACRWDRLKQHLVRISIVGPRIKHALRPRLTFSDLDDDAVDGKAGKPLLARIKNGLDKMREEALSLSAGEYDLDFGSPREEFADQVSESKTLQTALDSASEANDQAKIVVALVKIATLWLPIRRFKVAGALEPPSSEGPAMMLSVEEEDKAEASIRIVGAKTKEPKAEHFMPLADPAAVWVQYEIASALDGKEWDAEEAESQALLREGLEFYRHHDYHQAKAAFEKAITKSLDNWGAYLSLAVCEARLGGNYKSSIGTLLKALERIKAQ